MANYQELLSKAVGALPENNGASRRDVYEKARKALVAQLRAINPPLPAREITQHRLELEDCIREVEHGATEALLGGLKEAEEETIPVAPPAEEPAAVEAQVEEAPAVSEKSSGDEKSVQDKVASVQGEKESSEPVQSTEPAVNEIQAEKAVAATTDSSDTQKQSEALDDIIAEAEKSKADVSENGSSNSGSVIKPSEEKPTSPAQADKPDDRVSLAKTQSDKGIGAAMSRVREVENEVPSTAVKGPVITQAAPMGAPPAGMATKSNSNGAAAHVGSPLEGADAINVDGASAGGAKPVSGAALSDAQLLAQKLTGEVQTGSQTGGQASGEDDAQLVVDRAIQTLDREARGESGSDVSSQDTLSHKIDRTEDLSVGEAAFSSVGDEEKSSGGLTIFLVLVILLLGAVGGGGYWAWQEGYVDLDSVFASSGEDPEGAQVTDEPIIQTPPTSVRQVGASGGDDASSGPGNTATDVETDNPSDPNVALEDPNKSDERLTPAQGTTTDTQDDANVAQPNGGDDKVEDRLGTDTNISDPALTQEGDPANIAVDAGAQSLLLEASSDGTSGAVPFSGTVEWSRGVDELGEPTLIGQANIPARNLNVKVLIRRNGDASLPASHLMEIDFDVNETFVGGAVAGLPGILLKNEELVQGVALIGASARVVGNSFLFALSAADQDIRTNLDLLENRKWMDLALIYASGNRAIITLEKDDAAQALFRDVMATWQSASGGNAPDTSSVVLDSVDGAAEGATDLIQ